MSAVADVSTSSNPLICGACGGSALDVHLLPWPDLSREPERAVLSCGDCNAGGLRIDLDDWLIGPSDRGHPDRRCSLRDDYLKTVDVIWQPDKAPVDEGHDGLLLLKSGPGHVVSAKGTPVLRHGRAAVELVDARLDGSSADAGSFEPVTGKPFDEMLLDAFVGEWEEPVPRYKPMFPGDYIDGIEPESERYLNVVQPVRKRIVDMVEAIKQSAEPIDYACAPICARGFLTVVSGRRGDAKSWLAIAMAHAVHSGQESVGGWLDGLRCRHGRAMYVDAENGPLLLARRFVAMNIADNGLVVVDATGMQLPRDIDDLFALCDIVDPTLIVLDSLRRLAPLVREDRSDDLAPLMAELSQLARERNVAVLLIAHRSTKIGASDTRGSSAIEDQADCVFVLERLPNDPDRDRRRLRCTKHRLAREPAAMWWRLAKTAGFVSIEAAEPFQKAEVDDEPVPAPEALADRIRALAPQVLADDGWAPSRVAEAVGAKQRSGTFKRAIGALLESGEWDASGHGRARRLRPANELGQQMPLIGGGPVGPVDSVEEVELATPEQEALLGRAQRVVEGEGAQG
jgi:hypothetical protein